MTNPNPLILVVDDEPQIQRFLGHTLGAAGYRTIQAMNGKEAHAAIARAQPDLVILDLGLPDQDGKDILIEIRKTSDLPIIILSARDQEMEKILALDLGANDFVAKPFAVGELLARLRVCLRATKTRPAESRLRLGPLLIDVPSHRILRNDEVVHLTPKEFDLLVALAAAPGRVLTHRQLLSKVWGPAHVDDVPYLRVFIGQLRQKIEADPAEPRLILTEPGIGYRANGET